MNKRKLSITLNPKQALDAQLIAALELVGGEAATAIKLLAIRGVMTDPAMSSTLGKGLAISDCSKKTNGKGNGFAFKPKDTTAAGVESSAKPETLPAASTAPVDSLEATKEAIKALVSAPFIIEPAKSANPADDLSNF